MYEFFVYEIVIDIFATVRCKISRLQSPICVKEFVFCSQCLLLFSHYSWVSCFIIIRRKKFLLRRFLMPLMRNTLCVDELQLLNINFFCSRSLNAQLFGLSFCLRGIKKLIFLTVQSKYNKTNSKRSQHLVKSEIITIYSCYKNK